MASGTLAKPGSSFGPCEEDCEHTDCALTRKMAAEKCPLCLYPIGYETHFYEETLNKGEASERKALVHATCLDEAVEAQR